jgi:uncharacterized protein YdhG (YjbR/CyaY superfamily)
MKAFAANTIDEYLEALPEKERTTLEKLRAVIKSAAPKAEETISYQMPAFKYHGMLVYFAAFKKHCSLFPGGSSMLSRELDKEMAPYKTSKGTLQFTVDKPLPASLVKKIVKLRMKQNEENVLAKQLKKSSAKKTAKRK